LIVTRDRLDRHRKIYLPWKADYFRHRVAEIRTAAEISSEANSWGCGTVAVRKAAMPI
jgi:hypothetical protein